MKNINYCIIAVSMILLSACAFNKAPFQTYPALTQVELNQNNFRVVGEAYGTSKQIYVFGIGGWSKKSLESNAIVDMYKSAKLEGSQAIVNVSTIINTQIVLGIYVCRRAIAYGTIIEFTGGDQNGANPSFNQPMVKENDDKEVLSSEPTQKIEVKKEKTTRKKEQKKVQQENVQQEPIAQQVKKEDIHLDKFDAQTRKDLCYIAYLKKTELFNKKYQKSVEKSFDQEVIDQLSIAYTDKELLTMSKGCSKKVKEYRK